METIAFSHDLPPAAAPALAIAADLHAAGHRALLAGGCVRDFLLGDVPADYDVATDAPPERVCALLRPTRRVGAAFGVVLVKRQRVWVEVATFRSDGPYLDGRHPASVRFTDEQHDAQRRDFTINGLFFDPRARAILDYVGGAADLRQRCIRAIGEPAARFAEDHLRLLRAVRFAARLGFEIEPATLSALRRLADQLATVAAERIRDELQRMLVHCQRAAAWRMLASVGLLPYLWNGAAWSESDILTIAARLERLPAAAPFDAALALIVLPAGPPGIERAVEGLALSNRQADDLRWLVQHAADLLTPGSLSLAELKRLMAHRAFSSLLAVNDGLVADMPDAAARRAQRDERIAKIDPQQVQPRPWVTGADLAARRVEPGPPYRRVLETLYTAQLDERLRSRAEALIELDAILQREGLAGPS